MANPTAKQGKNKVTGMTKKASVTNTAKSKSKTTKGNALKKGTC